MKIKLKDKYKKIKKIIGGKIPKFLSLLIIRVRGFNILKNGEKKEKKEKKRKTCIHLQCLIGIGRRV